MMRKVALGVSATVGLLVGSFFLARAGMAPNWSTDRVRQDDVAVRVKDLCVGGGSSSAWGKTRG